VTRSKVTAAQIEQRRESLPTITIPETLPISAHQESLQKLIQDNPVLVVCGETGSGKSTQIPKICLAAGYGINGMICQTQPRRIAARSVAERISEEVGSPLGSAVGYRVRFSEQISEQNYIRVLTDGMLLAEFERDRYLDRYEVLIVDEAHERTLNIDFLLGLARKIIARRPEFRLIVTSATLDSEKFSKHFNDAPAIKVSGRTYPVEYRYCSLQDDGVDGLPEAIYGAVETLFNEAPADTLVFLPGEREIREAADWLGKRVKPGIEILPLYARLTPSEQHRIFHPGSKPRIILATNVAETSLTVPGVRYVIDSGLARVSRYSPTRKLQRLPLEKISKAAADQRAGRCGRIASGICVRLYDEEDYTNRAEYTDPEILRTSLADVILRMKTMGIGDIETFPFLDRPGRRQINDGLQHLRELGAVDDETTITAVGRQIARIPVDPRIARMLLAAEALNCLNEVVIIAAALSVPDPRQSPSDKLQHARQVHRALSEETSDFLVQLDIWRQFRRIQKHQSKRQSYKWCEQNYLSVFRMREWGALQANIKSILKQLNIRSGSEPADADTIHRALLPGLIANVAQLAVVRQAKQTKERQRKKERGAEYTGTFGKSLKIFPGSALRDKTPKWIMSAQLVETGQVFARIAAPLQPHWLETTAAHLLQFHYSGPSWDPRQERVVARRRATLYGLTIYSGRKCDYSKINPVDCRMIFIRSALVDGGLDSRLPFYDHNRELVAEIESLEHKTRRRDILVDDAAIYQFYDQVIPAWVNSASALRKWHRSLDESGRDGLMIPRELLMLNDQSSNAEDYPDELLNNGIPIALRYLFDPADEHDGVTAQIRLPLLNQVRASVFDKLVPGMLREKLIAMVRSLPKASRRHFVPIPEVIDKVIERVQHAEQPVTVALAEALNDYKSLDIQAADFDLSNLPKHLVIGLELVDEENKVIGFGRELETLKSQFGLRAHLSFVNKGDADIHRQGIKRWDFEPLPQSIPVKVGEYQTEAYPALVDCEDSVSIEVFDDEAQALTSHQEGVRRLLWLSLPAHRKLAKKPLPEWQRISLLYAAIGDLSALQTAMFYKAQDQVFFTGRSLARSRKEFESLLNDKAGLLPQTLLGIASAVAESLVKYRAILQFIEENKSALPGDTLDDVNEQLEWLIYDGFVDDVPVQWLPHVPRFLSAIKVRLEQAMLDPGTDRLRHGKVSCWWRRYLDCEYDYSEDLEQWRWMLEEFRVSVFAQGLKTSIRVSAKRLEQGWKALEDSHLRRV